MVSPSHLALPHLRLSDEIQSPIYLPYEKWPFVFTRADTHKVKTAEVEWEAFWKSLSRVRVRALVVEIIDSAARVPEQVLLEPLNRVSAGSFEVILPWPAGLKTSGSFGNALSTVRRPPEGVDLMMDFNVMKHQECVGPNSNGRFPRWRIR